MWTGAHWATVAPLLSDYDPLTADLREMVNARLYLVRAGCPWRYRPTGSGAWEPVHAWHDRLRADGSGPRSPPRSRWPCGRHADVRTDMARYALQDEQIRERVDHVDRLELAGHADRPAFVPERIDHVQHPIERGGDRRLGRPQLPLDATSG